MKICLVQIKLWVLLISLLSCNVLNAMEKVEAEDYSDRRNVKSKTVHWGYKGDGYLKYNQKGSWAEWNDIQVNKAGLYKISFRYSNEKGKSFNAELVVNDAEQGSVVFPTTESGEIWKNESILVPLKRGTNTLRLVASSNDGRLNLDRLKIKFINSNGDNGGGDSGGDSGGGNNGKLKVFILAGQSNMVGHGTVMPEDSHIARNGGMGTLDYFVNKSQDGLNHQHLIDDNGDWAERNDVWITNLKRSGPLSIGYGNDQNHIGPELQFGHVMGDHFNNPVLIIKASWGGKSLDVDFRPPSSGGKVGPYYSELIDAVHDVLDNIEQEYPNYSGKGFEIAGFGWHQGWNDRVNQDRVDAYQTNLVNFINDIRDEFDLPKLPFVIAITGMKGWNDDSEKGELLREAQLATPDDPRLESNANVVAVETRDYWRDEDVSPSSQGFHWNRNGETQFHIGNAMGNAIVTLAEGGSDGEPDGGSDSGSEGSLSLTVNNGSGSGVYAHLDKVSIEAYTAPSGQVFDRWIVNSGKPRIIDPTASTAILKIKKIDAVVTATYKNESTGTGKSMALTVTRIDARPSGHPLDSGIESDPIIDLAFMQAEGAAGSSKTSVQITGPSVIRVPDWIPDSEKTHPDAKYYMYFAAHGSDMISLAWAKSITGKWHLFNRGDASNRAWGMNGNYTGTETPGTGVLDLNIADSDVMWFDDNFGVDGHIASPDVVVDNDNERIILYFHGPMHKIIGLSGTGNFVATSQWGLNFNLREEGGEKGQGPRNVLVAAQYVKTFEVEGEDNGKKVMRTFAFVNGADLWAAPIRTRSGSIASHANADERGGYFTPSWSGDPTPVEHPNKPGEKPYLWEEYKAWTDANPFTGVIKAPELVPPENDDIVRKKNEDPRHFAIHHDPANDRDKVYVMYTSRHDLPESIVMIVFDLAGLTETERLDPSLWKRVSDVEQVLLKPELVWEGVGMHSYKQSASGGGHGYQFRDPDVFQDRDGKIYLFYCGQGEGAIGVAEVKLVPQSTNKSLTMTSPFRGYTYLIGKERNVGWETTGDITSVDIEYTVNGNNWIEIATGVQNTHYYTWTIPDTPSDIAQVRIMETGGDLVAISDPFFIAAEKTLFMVRPTAGGSVRAGSEYGLNWASVGDITKVDLKYTLDGNKWITIAKSVPNPGPFVWTVPNIKANNVRVRISETNGSVISISDPFSIVK